MPYLALLIAFLFISLSAQEEPSLTVAQRIVCDMEREPSALVDGRVNIITGDYVETATDLYIPGVEPIAIQRFYSSGDSTDGTRYEKADKGFGHFWRFNHDPFIKHDYCAVDGYVDPYWETSFRDEEGMQVPFLPIQDTFQAKVEFKVDPEFFDSSVTNSSRGVISGKTNVANITGKGGRNPLFVKTGDGSHYSFTKKPNQYEGQYFNYDLKIGRPSGLATLYQNRDTPGKPKVSHVTNRAVVMLDRKSKQLNRAEIHSVEDRKTGFYTMGINSSDGRKVDYLCGQKDKETFFMDVISDHAPKQHYEYGKKHPGKIIRRESGAGNFVEVDYYDHHINFVGEEKVQVRHRRSSTYCKVKEILEPVGTDATPIATRRFIYHPKMKEYIPGNIPDCLNNHPVIALDAENHMTIYGGYYFGRVMQIARCTGTRKGDYKLYTVEHIEWNGHKLTGRKVCDADNDAKVYRRFKYDGRGNILDNELFGDLTGNGNSNECLKESYTYSNDGMNLMTSQSNARRKIVYTYHTGTNYLEAKRIIVQGTCVKRFFYRYDDYGAVSEEIVDNGSGDKADDLTNVTQRVIKKMVNSGQAPVGLPLEVEESYWDPNTCGEVLLGRVCNSYDKIGNLLEQQRYDNLNNHAYTLTWEYDVWGRCVRSSDALGQVTEKQYDDSGNVLFEQGPSPDFHVESTYDFMNRLIRKQLVAADGTRYVNRYAYDLHSNKISETDHYGNTTYYKYDGFDRVVEIVHPLVETAEGDVVAPVEKFTYDILDNVVEKVATDGSITTQQCTIRGKPYRICHPDGSEEKITYTLFGEAAETIAKNGTRTLYSYDWDGREVEVKVVDAQGVLMSCCKKIYDAFNLIEEVDAEDHHTFYSYDAAGRLIRKESSNRLTEYFYDSLGRLYEAREHDGKGGWFSTVTKKDLLDRVVEDSVQDHEGKLFTKSTYAYDELGRRVQICCCTGDGVAITKTAYSIFGHPVEVTDPLGAVTHFEYLYDHVNAIGQSVPCVKTTDPLGNVATVVSDTRGHIVDTQVCDVSGVVVQKGKKFYDLTGRLVMQRQEVFGRESAPVENMWEYDVCGRLTAQIEAVGQPEQKVTRYVYNSFGEKSDEIRADGTKICYGYDGMGRLSACISEDGTIDYRYSYDRNGHPIEILDNVRGTVLRKSFNEYGQLLTETMGNGLTLSFEYDALGRPVTVILPDQSHIVSEYDLRLKTIGRYDSSGNHLYSHHYSEIDLVGNVKESQLIGNAGTLLNSFDLKQQLVDRKCAHWSERQIMYDPAGNLIGRIVEDARGLRPEGYRYDALHQLVSESGAQDHLYSYDSLYNRTSKDGKRCVINALNQLVEHDGVLYEYDAVGGLVSKSSDDDSWNYRYDAFGRLIVLEKGGCRYEYLYDSENRRLGKIESLFRDGAWIESRRENYLYQGLNEIGTCDESGRIFELRVLGLGLGAEIGAAIAIETGGCVYAPVHDHAGNVVALIDAETGNLETYRYTAYGEEIDAPAAALTPWRFSSKRVDPESGLVYFGRRYYDPEVGRWMTPDPIGFEGGPNLYAYVMNNPLTHLDLYGLDVETISKWETGSRTKSFFGKVREKVGNFISMIGDHLLPIPFVRQAVSYIGHRIAGHSHEYAFRQQRKQHSCSFELYGKKELDPHAILVNIGGMLTNYEDHGYFGYQSCDAHDGANVHICVNSTNGFIMDLLESFCNILGIKTAIAKRLEADIKHSIYNILGGVDSGGIVLLRGHSQGGPIIKCSLRGLTPEERRMIFVTTYGSAKFISSEGLAGAINYVDRDLVAILCNIPTCIKSLFTKCPDVVFRDGYARPGFNHGMGPGSYYHDMMKMEGARNVAKYRGK